MSQNIGTHSIGSAKQRGFTCYNKWTFSNSPCSRILPTSACTAQSCYSATPFTTAALPNPQSERLHALFPSCCMQEQAESLDIIELTNLSLAGMAGTRKEHRNYYVIGKHLPTARIHSFNPCQKEVSLGLRRSWAQNSIFGILGVGAAN